MTPVKHKVSTTHVKTEAKIAVHRRTPAKKPAKEGQAKITVKPKRPAKIKVPARSPEDQMINQMMNRLKAMGIRFKDKSYNKDTDTYRVINYHGYGLQVVGDVVRATDDDAVIYQDKADKQTLKEAKLSLVLSAKSYIAEYEKLTTYAETLVTRLS